MLLYTLGERLSFCFDDFEIIQVFSSQCAENCCGKNKFLETLTALKHIHDGQLVHSKSSQEELRSRRLLAAVP